MGKERRASLTNSANQSRSPPLPTTTTEPFATSALKLAKNELGFKGEVRYVADVFLDADDLLWPPTT